MGFIISCILLVFGILLYSKYKSFSSPEVFFCFEWFFISFLASLRLFTLYEASARTWFIVLVGCVSFLIGCSFGTYYKVSNDLSIKEIGLKQGINIKLVFGVVVTILIISEIGIVLQSIPLLINGVSLSSIRDASYGEYTIEGIQFIKQSDVLVAVLGTVGDFTTAAGIAYFVSNIKKNYWMFICVMIFEVFKTLSDGGRFNLAYILLELFVCFLLFNKNKRTSLKERKSRKKIIIMFLIILCVAIVGASLLRSVDINELVQHFYMYICGDVVLLDIKLENLDKNFYSLGLASFYGLFNFVFPVLNSKLKIPLPNLWIGTVTKVMTGQQMFNVGEKLSMNAFVTPFYYLYADLRIFGVILGMFLFGFVAKIAYKRAIRMSSYFDIVVYLIIVQIIFKSLQTYPLVMDSYALTLLFVLLYRFIKRIKRS